MANYLLDGEYVEYETLSREGGVGGPSNIENTHDGDLSTSSYAYDRTRKSEGDGSWDFWEWLTADVVGKWEYWFNADQDNSYGIWVDEITTHPRVRGVNNGETAGTTYLYLYADLWVYRQDLDAWDKVGNDDASWSAGNSASSIDKSVTHTNAVGGYICGIRYYVRSRYSGDTYYEERIYAYAYNREVQAIGDAKAAPIRISNGGRSYPLLVDDSTASSLRVAYPDSNQNITAHMLSLVDTDSSIASPLRVRLPYVFHPGIGVTGGVKSVAFFGRYSGILAVGGLEVGGTAEMTTS